MTTDSLHSILAALQVDSDEFVEKFGTDGENAGFSVGDFAGFVLPELTDDQVRFLTTNVVDMEMLSLPDYMYTAECNGEQGPMAMRAALGMFGAFCFLRGAQFGRKVGAGMLDGDINE